MGFAPFFLVDGALGGFHRRMRSFYKLLGATACGALLFALAGCSSVSHTQPTPLRVAVAESLRPAMLEIADAYAERQPFVRIDIIAGNSRSLTRQMLKKVPADIASLDSAALLNELVEKDIVVGKSRTTLLINALVCFVKTDSPLKSFETFLENKSDKLAVGDFQETALGQYTELCFENLKCAAALKDRLVPVKSSDAVVAAVLNGNAAAGVAYQSTLAVSRGVRVLTQFPLRHYGTIAYDAGVLRAAPHYGEAWEFLAFLRGAEAAKIFRDHGLTSPFKATSSFN